MKRSLVIYDYVLMFYACLTLETFDSPLDTLLAVVFNNLLVRRSHWPIHTQKVEIWRHSTITEQMERHWKITFTDRVSTQTYNLGQGESLQLKVQSSISHCQVKLRIHPALLYRVLKNKTQQNENEPLTRNFFKLRERNHNVCREFCWVPQPNTRTD